MSRRDPDAAGGIAARIGYEFADPDLLAQALTHISALSQDRRVSSYQRLEFLGDRVLGLVVAAMLYESFDAAHEGEMSRRLAALVRRETCAEVASEWDLGSAVRLGESEQKSGGRTKPAILSDTCEAVIGAVFLDGGYGAADAVIRKAWTPRMQQPARPLQDPKTTLQEWVQSLGKPTPAYREIARRGPAHRPDFTVCVEVEGMGQAEGTGASKRLAEQIAAESFLRSQGLLPATPAPGPVAA